MTMLGLITASLLNLYIYVGVILILIALVTYWSR